MTELLDEDDDYLVRHLRYSWTLCLEHPAVAAEAVEAGLGWGGMLERVDWRACPGGFRVVEDGGATDGLRWAGRVERERYRDFFAHLCELASHLEERRAFLDDYMASGGRGVFVLRLFGGWNIGTTLRARDVMRVGRLGTALRVEVAPVW